jgi:hypothetical protein
MKLQIDILARHYIAPNSEQSDTLARHRRRNVGELGLGHHIGAVGISGPATGSR